MLCSHIVNRHSPVTQVIESEGESRIIMSERPLRNSTVSPIIQKLPPEAVAVLQQNLGEVVEVSFPIKGSQLFLTACCNSFRDLPLFGCLPKSKQKLHNSTIGCLCNSTVTCACTLSPSHTIQASQSCCPYINKDM